MSTYTITTPVNIDSLTNKQGADVYIIHGGYLTIDQDSRYGLNNSLSSSMLTILISTTLGGTVEINSTKVRLISFVSGSGTVPVSNTTIQLGTASGSLIGVWPTLTSSALLTGSAMPSSGYLKIKQWNSVTFSTGTLTGISASSTGPDVPGWIEIVGTEAGTFTVPRLGLFKIRGDWYNIGSTTGDRSSSYQIPTNGQLLYVPGVWVEKTVSSNDYEFYPYIGASIFTASAISTDPIRGKFCWISTGGLLRFGNDGVNQTGGYLPSASLGIRIPNIFLTNHVAGTPQTTALPNATMTTRFESVTTNGGVVDIDKASCSWYLNLSQPYSVVMTNTGVMTTMILNEIATPISFSQIGVGQEGQQALPAMQATNLLAGGTMDNCTWTSSNQVAASRYINSWTDCKDFQITNERNLMIATRSITIAGSVTLLRVANSSWTRSVLGGQVNISTCDGVTFTSSSYYDYPNSLAAAAGSAYMFNIAGAAKNIKIDTVDLGGLRLTAPYTGLFAINFSGESNIKIRNVGTYNNPLDLGGDDMLDVPWSRIGTTATITSSNHGLRVGDFAYVGVCSDVAAVAVGSKTVTAISGSTFSFVCLNAGSTTGTANYYIGGPSYVAYFAAGSLVDCEMKRVYVKHTKINTFLHDNTNKNIVLENVHGEFWSPSLINSNNTIAKGMAMFGPATANASCYGTTWLDQFTAPITPNTSSQSWSRITTTAYVTSSNHGLKTGDLIAVVSSSNLSGTAVTGGSKSITVLNSSIFSFAATNSGATTGLVSFVPASSRIMLMMNEKTIETSDYYTITGGTPSFTSAGSLYMPNVGDEIMFEMPYYVIGHTGFCPLNAIMTTGVITNHNIYYAIDKNDGLGFGTGSLSGSWKNLNYSRAGGGGTTGQFNITMTSTDGVQVGDYVFGTNIQPLSKVVSINSPTSVTLDQQNIGAVSGILQFYALPNEIVNAEDGFKLRILIRTVTANVAAFSYLTILTTSDNVSRAYQYPLDIVPITITNLKNPSEVRVFAYGTTEEVAGQENITNGTFVGNVDLARYPVVDISVLSLGYQNTRYLSQSLGSDGLTLLASQVVDRQYQNP